MIRIAKPAAPGVLTSRGRRSAAGFRAAYHRNPAAYRAKGFEPDARVYAHPDVKAALRKAQYDKCAFCESKVTHIGFGDVEHYRPKGGYKQRESDPLGYPGYYWLAYDWDNLFLSCSLCNQKFKRNLFPLADPSRRALCHDDDVTGESPDLLHPERDRPEDHITFADELPVPHDGSTRGAATISVLGLDRDELNRERDTHRRVLLALRRSRDSLSRRGRPTAAVRQQLAELDRLLADAILPSAEYAAMARVVLA